MNTMKPKIGFCFNVKSTTHKGDHDAEYETPETIEAIERVLKTMGKVIRLPCDPQLPQRVVSEKPDIVFNIAEGYKASRNRESFAPALFEMLDISFTGSDATSLGITQDKALAKLIAQSLEIPTQPFHVINSLSEISQSYPTPTLSFPLFLKPNWEGTSRGITKASLVANLKEFTSETKRLINTYYQPVLIEPYIEGRDLTVGILEDSSSLRVFPVAEVILGHREGIPFFSYEYKELDSDHLSIPADISKQLEDELCSMSELLFKKLGLRGYARIDWRTDKAKNSFFLEINALPGLSPVSGIFTRQAEAAGISFHDLILTILSSAR